MRKLCIVAALTMLSACAKSPDAIPPVNMTGAYDKMSCRAAASALSAERQNLAALDTSQRKAVTGDAIGVFLVGVPVSSLTGNDKAGDIGTSKGKIIALEQRLVSC